MLPDEADVFLAQRACGSTLSNSLVSVFLRQIEHYQGILFLTTNQIHTFDKAAVSRVHYGLRYSPLDFNARKGIWQRFIAKAGIEKGSAECTSEEIEQLAREELNGREVGHLCPWCGYANCSR